MMEFATIQLDIFPLETATLNHGIGFLPYILDLRADDITMPLPSSGNIKSVACDLLSRAIMPTIKKSRKTWDEAMLKGAWIARESSKVWPLPINSDDETNETDNISGDNLFYILNFLKTK